MSRCAECKYFQLIAPMADPPYGDCRLNPPSPTMRFPTVFKEDWCGQFAAAKPTELAIGSERRCVDCQAIIGNLTTCPSCLTPQVHA